MAPPNKAQNNNTVGGHGHVPVLLTAVLDALAISDDRSDLTYVDATLGAGGHSWAVAQQLSDKATLLGIDQDKAILQRTTQWLKENTATLASAPTLAFCHGAFGNIANHAGVLPEGMITGGILADIGVSSMQLDEAERGFSFRKDAPLDMRMNPGAGSTVAQLIAEADEATLSQWLWEFGEERKARQIAKVIVTERDKSPITTTTQLAELVKNCVAKQSNREQQWRIHPATKTFQALRIVANDELGQLDALLTGLPAVLTPGARVAIISFHSLEDRMVKRAFKHWQQEGWGKPLTKKPIVATDDEIATNPRSRSAKLRVFDWQATL